MGKVKVTRRSLYPSYFFSPLEWSSAFLILTLSNGRDKMLKRWERYLRVQKAERCNQDLLQHSIINKVIRSKGMLIITRTLRKKQACLGTSVKSKKFSRKILLLV